MKKTFILFLLSVVATFAQAQSSPLELNLYGGYTFRDKVDLYDTYAYVNDAFQYGAGLEYYFDRSAAIELRYLRMDTKVPLYKYGLDGEQTNPNEDKASINYILLGGNYYWGTSQAKAEPYGAFSMGVGIADAKEGGSITKFAYDFRLGVKIKTPSMVSIKLHAYLQSIVGGYGGGFYLGTGGAVIGTGYSYVSLLQFGLGGAIALNFKK